VPAELEVGAVVTTGEIDGVSVCYCINEKVWNQAAVLLQSFFSPSTQQNSCC
jgi:hypothetical protein